MTPAARGTPGPAIRVLVALLASALALLVAAGLARADTAYDTVAAAYAQAGGQLDPCQFTQAELEAAISGIPPQLRDVVPDLRRAMEDGVAAHERGDCAGVEPGDPGGGATADGGAAGGGAATGGDTPASATPAPADGTPAPTPAPSGAEPAPATPDPAAPAANEAATPPVVTAPAERDLTPLWVALVVLGALLLGLLALWALARMRGWDPPWAARVRHAWGEAGFRTTSTWAEFTDWLRLGR